MSTTPIRHFAFCLALILALASFASTGYSLDPNQEQNVTSDGLTVQYLEIVTPSVDETCDALEKMHGVTFGEAVAELGNARTAQLKSGGRIGVRAPMRETEEPVVRPYLLIDDIHAATQAAEDAGAVVAIPPMEIPGQGTFAIYILGGIEHGLWQIGQ